MNTKASLTKAQQDYCAYLQQRGVVEADAIKLARQLKSAKNTKQMMLDLDSHIPAAEVKKRARSTNTAVFDYRTGGALPAYVREAFETHLAIEREDAIKAGKLGFMTRALVLATMPHREPKNSDGTPCESFTRRNGNMTLRMVAGDPSGLPYGLYPRLLLNWVTTECVRTGSPVIELGPSLNLFLREVLDVTSRSGGPRGSGNRVRDQMRRLFGSLITVQQESAPGKNGVRGFALKNVLLADELRLAPGNDFTSAPGNSDQMTPSNDTALWTPQQGEEAGQWKSVLKITQPFFEEIMSSPVPVDNRAIGALRKSPLAIDIYIWWSWRVSFLKNPTRPIPWEVLALQFGSGYGAHVHNDEGARWQAVLDFKRNFMKAVRYVELVYPDLRYEAKREGLIIHPSKPHVARLKSAST